MAAAGTIVQSSYLLGHVRRLRFACTASVDDGSFPDTIVAEKIEGRLLKLVTTPGATNPTAAYDVTLVDQSGHDVLEGVGADRSATVVQHVPIVYTGTSLHPAVDEADTLTLQIANNAVHGAGVTIDLYFALGA